MNIIRLNYKRLSLWVIFALQIILLYSYFFLEVKNPSDHTTPKVSFISAPEKLKHINIKYLTLNQKIALKYVDTSEFYMDFNSSVCFINGTDLQSMQNSKRPNWKCNCLLGWHGNDCGQPEVIWRSLLSHRKAVSPKGPRKYQRRVIAVLEVNKFSLTITEIKVNELNSTIDLFVLYENDTSNCFLKKQLNSNFLKNYHDRILYVEISNISHLWGHIKDTLTNLREDDVVLLIGPNSVPNNLALQFFKLYDKWPQPFQFRYKWSVYGFFWQHPSKTIVQGGGCTVSYLYDSLNNQIQDLHKNRTKNFTSKDFIIGDLNHFGGWYCQFCYDPPELIAYIMNLPDDVPNLFNRENKLQIDSSYIEDLIENGVYLDGKTELLRTHQFRDRYFAPKHVMEYNWKYDSFLINLYSKLDY